ncbi:LYR motif containing protein 1-like, partial [Dendronephthya gigantea]|uniref:LYR motif containing protein 1-like n=1 Tax=Dendronephthya gigantea TaxID=151771 RepID=UPI00106AB604
EKTEVLAVYRRILRVARSWKASSGLLKDTLEERSYIVSECRDLFRKNSKVTSDEEIGRCLEEAKSRLELAMHYGNPYPRPVNLPPKAIALQGKTKMKSQERAKKQAKPVYLNSY